MNSREKYVTNYGLITYIPDAPDSSSDEDKFIVWRLFSSARGSKLSITVYEKTISS